MAKAVVPEVFIIAETGLVRLNAGQGLQGFLNFLGVPDWQTDAASPAEELCEIAGKSCYLSFSTDLNKNLTKVGARRNYDYIQQGIVSTRHGSVLEHATVTLAFVNVSRVFTHELVRHRVGAAYSQVSGRYVRTDQINYFLPGCIQAEPQAVEYFNMAFQKMEKWMHELGGLFGIDDMKDFKVKKMLTSAFRRLIGNGQANHIIATFNHRTLRHIIELRTDESAEEEIRTAFCKVFNMVCGRYPAIYNDAVLHQDNKGELFQVKFQYGRV